MIEIVEPDRCIACDRCIEVCPTRVFDRGADGAPVIARQDSCQTCFQCEAYCPTDALLVAPLVTAVAPGSRFLDVTQLEESGLLGGSGVNSAGAGEGRSVPAPRSDRSIRTDRPEPAQVQHPDSLLGRGRWTPTSKVDLSHATQKLRKNGKGRRCKSYGFGGAKGPRGREPAGPFCVSLQQ
ncbi:4Fe-4S dicluster domain-containing protein [Streptomyces broussonetiae]|uniref:4Fe-4S dicluster domain-containing protein n=1 Tax=Streptomyces broussonetiae TaxID=2686304 RepID=UPI0018EEE983|nr:ferredoxin family protein [Streptomyces broussonetiae]